MNYIVSGRPLQRHSKIHILNLDLIFGENGVLRMGRRIDKVDLPNNEKHPIIVIGDSHIVMLFVRKHYDCVKQSGCHITEEVIRMAGTSITGVQRLIMSWKYTSVVCRKLRGCFSTKKRWVVLFTCLYVSFTSKCSRS